MTEEKKSTYPSKEAKDKLMGRRTVWLYGKITEEVINDVTERILLLQASSPERINLIIESGGGSMEFAFSLCDIMDTTVIAPIRGIALRQCGSAATYIMLHCTERVGTPHARFLVHSGFMGGNHFGNETLPIGRGRTKAIQQLDRHLKQAEDRLYNMYMSQLTPEKWRTQLPSEAERKKYVKRLFRRGDQRFDKWMPAEEAIEVGLITGIMTEKLDIFSA